jgi:hypothetical protein
VVARLLGNRYCQAALVLLVVAALFLVTGALHPFALAQGRKPVPLGDIPVTAAIRACASPGGQRGGGVAVISAGAISASTSTGSTSTGSTGTGPGGSAVVSRLSAVGSVAAGPVLSKFSQTGKLTRIAVPVAPAKSGKPTAQSTSGGVPAVTSLGGVAIRASAGMSGGLAAEQTGPTGLPQAACPAPATDFWFVSPGQHTLATLSLYLMNADSSPADAEVDLFTDSGPVLGSTDTGITVPPHGLLVQSLAKVVHGSRVLGLHVRTSAGRVVAMLHESRTAGQPGSWIPASPPPSRYLVIPGLPATAGSRSLFLLVPGATPAQVKLTAVTGRGSYQPTGGNGISLAGGSAGTVPLPSLSKVPAALAITASQPVTAVLSASGGGPGSPGVFAAASGPVAEQGVAADNVAGPNASASLVLSAPAAAVQVRLTELTPGRPPRTREVTIEAKHSTVVPLGKPPGRPPGTPYALVITPLPGSGPLYAGRAILSNGSVQAIIAVPAAPTTIRLPVVDETLSVARP